MNDYIINPWFFYWLDVITSVVYWHATLLVLSGLSTVAGLIAYAISFDCYGDDKRKFRAFCRRVCRVSIPVFVIFTVLTVFIPTREAMIQMAIAERATYSNVEKAKTSAKELVDYVIKKTKELSKDK